MKRWLFALAGLAGFGLASDVAAHVEADPNKEYAITPEAGPWMVYATCYVGPQAVSLAHEMILELRSRHDLPAYVFNRGAEERRQQEQELQQRLQQLRQQYPDYPEELVRRGTRKIQDQCAVLIGGYEDIDAAKRALKVVKELPPPSSERLKPFVIRERPDEQPGGEAQSQVEVFGRASPFMNSFVTRNPTVPATRPVANKAEEYKLYKKLNAGESFSLLKCRKPWTLVVATYQGVQGFQDKESAGSFLDKVLGKNSGEVLEKTGEGAHNLAGVLHRVLGYDTYVLHTRWGSVVTIGGFDRADDPKMRQVEQALATRMQLGPQVQLLAKPMAMEVPHP